MYQHILIPTDGSAVAETAAMSALKLARDWGAQATVLHVVPDNHALASTPAESHRAEEAPDHHVFKQIAEAAAKLGVKAGFFVRQSDRPSAAIVTVAMERRCDLIAMASHNRRGLAGLVAGSQTQKVLAHARVPVLVFNTI